MFFPRDKGNEKNRLLFDYASNLGNAVMRHNATTAHKAARVEAELANSENLSFIATMNHELRTPLNAILGFSEILSDAKEKKPPQELVAEYASYINDSANHLLDIVNGILEISKIQSGKLVLYFETVAPKDIINACVTMLSGVAKDADILIECNIDESLPMIRADPVKLRQIILNILGNAIKFTPEGGNISVLCLCDDSDEDHIKILIRDSGVGIPEDLIHVALEPFRQVETGLNRTFNGTGLGLPIAKALCEAHEGSLDIASTVDRGTEVTITLPLKSTEEVLP